jgi:hypothetical protein
MKGAAASDMLSLKKYDVPVLDAFNDWVRSGLKGVIIGKEESLELSSRRTGLRLLYL